MLFKREPVTRIYYASDIHGSERLWRKFLNAPRIYDVSVLIMGGDITGKAIVPIVRRNGQYICTMGGSEHVASTQDELVELCRMINYNGLYARTMEIDELARLDSDPAYREQVFQTALGESLRAWMAIAADKLRGKGVACYVMPGNDDPPATADILAESDVLVNPEGRCLQLDDHHEMISLGYSNPTPWNTVRELAEEDLLVRLEAMVPAVTAPASLIANLHAPPYDSRLDTAPQLDTDFKIHTAMGSPVLVPVGSRAVRTFIERHQPLLGLHGHIHESDGISQIGRTMCINPGSAYTDGVLSGVIVGLKKDGIAMYQTVRG